MVKEQKVFLLVDNDPQTSIVDAGVLVVFGLFVGEDGEAVSSLSRSRDQWTIGSTSECLAVDPRPRDGV
jgi:hypothetical protein